MRGLSVIIATCAIQTLTSMAVLVLPAVATTAGAALDLDPVLIGVQVSLLYATAMFAVLASGTFVRRYGACRTSQIGLLLAVAGCCAASLPSAWAIAAGSVLLGAAYGLPSPAASHLLQRFTDSRRRNLIFSVKQAGVPAGGILAGLIGPPLATSLSWQAPLLLTAILTLLLAALLERKRQQWDDDRRSSDSGLSLPLHSLSFLARNAALRAMAITGLLLAGVQLCLVAFLVVAFVDELGYGAVAAGAMLAFLQATSVAGRIGWGWLADRLGDGLAVLIVIAVLLAGSLLLATGFDMSTPAAVVIAVFVVISATAVAWNGIFMAELAHMSGPDRVGEVTGSVMFFTYLGVVIGPAGFTLILPAFGGVLPAYLVLAAASLAACGLLVAAKAAVGKERALSTR